MEARRNEWMMRVWPSVVVRTAPFAPELDQQLAYPRAMHIRPAGPIVVTLSLIRSEMTKVPPPSDVSIQLMIRIIRSI